MSMQQTSHLPSAIQVADYMLATAKCDYNLNLDQLQLNKLLHVTNGFVLRDRNDPAFQDDVEAWKYGPVVRTVWETYRDWGYEQIGHLKMCNTSLDDTTSTLKRRMELFKIIGRDIASVVSGVLKEYGKCTGNQLISMTHKKGTPWHDTYEPGRDNVIPTQSIALFYRKLSKDDDAR